MYLYIYNFFYLFIYIRFIKYIEKIYILKSKRRIYSHISYDNGYIKEYKRNICFHC